MEQINIKQEIMNLCDDFVVFWKQFKEEIDSIADDDKAELILKWKNYFVEHNGTTLKFIETNLHAKDIQQVLIEKGELFLEDFKEQY